LALALGMPVAELVERMPADEFSEWQAYWQLEPWGAWRDNWHAAQLSTLIYNINRGKHPSIKPAEFMYRDADTERDNNTRQFVAGLKALSRPKNG